MRLLKEFVKNPIGIGAVIPSSSHLARVITSDIGIEKAKTIVEIGPGSGVFTAKILKMIPSDTRYFLVELNPRIHRHLSQKYPNLKIYNDSAANLPALIKKENISSVEVVVSGLPWVSFPEELQRSLLDAIYDSMAQGGILATYGYLQGMLLPGGLTIRKLLKSRFKSVEMSEIVWRNLPPAFVYRCRK